MDDFILKMAGEITLSQNPGASLKKWRGIFGITQTELANYLKITPSTISDYEGSRRKSPGIGVIRRFVNAMCAIDKQKGGWTIKKLQQGLPRTNIYEVVDFSEPVNALEFCKKIEANVISNRDILKNDKIYGCTFVDSMKAILELSSDEFIKIYGNTTKRALIFTNIMIGRSPMVAIRISKVLVPALQPSIVVLHNITEVDRLAVKLSEIERIPLVTTLLPLNEIKKRVRSRI